MYEIGGDALVRLFDLIIAPIFGFVCTMEANLGGVWAHLAIFLESVLS